MGGPTQSQKNQQSSIANTQTGIGTQYAGMAQSELQKMNQLQQPSIDFYSGIVNSANTGDYSSLLGAAGPIAGTVSQAGENAKDQIYNTVPAGAGRDYALAQNKMNTANSMAGTLNKLYTGALGNLSSLGTEAGQVGLNETGASLSGLSSGATTNQNTMDREAQQKASTMGFFGSLAGAAGAAAGGGAFGSLGSLFGGGGGAGGGTPAMPSLPQAMTYSLGSPQNLSDAYGAYQAQQQQDMISLL